MYSEEERRQYPRWRHAEAVQYQFKDPRFYGGCLSCDLSEGGVRVRLNDFVPLNTEMTLQILLNDNTLVECTGKVVWVEKNRFSDTYQAGLEFNEESGRQAQRAISRFHYLQQGQN